MILVRVILVCAFALILFLPGWWAAGRILEKTAQSFFQLLCAVGLALIGYITFVNLLGRLIGNSITAVIIYLALNVVGSVLLWRRWPAELSVSSVMSTWRSWIGPVSMAVALGVPQWLLAVSTNFFDEAASSAIHLTAANQFAEGVFPPRHNAFPDVSIKYHYAFTILSGTVKWLTGLSANVSIDVVSTSLWLFVFLFVYFWFRQLDFGRFAATWAGFATLLGGGFAWLYIRRIEAYNGIDKVPSPTEMIYRYDPAAGWLAGVRATGQVPSLHLRNSDGTLSDLPWDIAAQFQQHAVSLGIALTLVALFTFVAWQKRPGVQISLLIANVVTFSVLFLAHSVFGAVAAVTGGICLLISWLRQPTRWRFFRGLLFGAGVAVLALMHGGLLVRGAQYGGNAATTFRHAFGYSAGGLRGFMEWNVAGFGLPLILALTAWGLYFWRRDSQSTERATLFLVLTVFALVSWFVPHLVFYSSDTSGVEQLTEISKFFFSAHLAFALLSAFAVSQLVRWVPWATLLPGFALMAITPLAFVYAGSFAPNNKLLGFYHSPYKQGSIEQQMGQALGRVKKSNHDVYFDASADERRHGYIGELLVFSGSVFTLTPSRYERTGIGYRLSEEVVARRFVENGRMARLVPGAAEGCSCDWYYSRPFDDQSLSPLIVRSRFNKLVAEGYFRKRFGAGLRALYSIDKSTLDLDYGIERLWRPNVVSQTKASTTLNEKDLIFFDLVNRKILSGNDTIQPPDWVLGELVQVYTARFPGDQKADFLLGRMKDTEFRLGRTLADIVERSAWAWTNRDSQNQKWQPENAQWEWDADTPFIADVDGDGFESQIAYSHRTGKWLLGPNQVLNGPRAVENDLPIPFAGRFLPGSTGDLGLWSIRTGSIVLRTVATGREVSLNLVGGPENVLVPGDYDGDGYDEFAVWQRATHTWYWRHAPDGSVTQVVFGTDTSVPVPADYNHDGRLDLAYWEPVQQKIFVSYSHGRSVDLVIPVPAHSIPAFINMY